MKDVHGVARRPFGAGGGTAPGTRWILLSLLALAAPSGALQPSHDLLDYLAVAERYRAGDRVTSRSRIEAWPWHRLDEVAHEIRRFGESLSVHAESGDEIEPGTIEAAALLHADVGLAALERRNGRLAERHISIADDHIGWLASVAALREKLRRDALLPPRHRLELRLHRRDLHLVLARVLLADGLPRDADEFAERAREASSDDAEVFVVSGMVAETLAHEARVQNRYGRADDRLEEAERYLRAALELDPGNAGASLRLGHVLLERGLPGAAVPLLRDALASTRDTDTEARYLGLLFLGRALERHGERTEAVAVYRRAVETWPDNQAARFALAQALEERSGLEEARSLVTDTLNASARATRRPDPWWSYRFGSAEGARASMSRLWVRVLGAK